MKAFLAICAATLVALSASAQGNYQQKIHWNSALTATNDVTLFGSSSNVVIDVTKWAEVGLMAQGKLNAAGTGVVTVVFEPSVDRVNYNATKRIALSLTMSGTNTIVGWTNVTTGPAGYYRVVGVTNLNDAASLNNFRVISVYKPKHQG